MAQDKRTASQRIEDLERAVMSLFQVNNNMARENSMIKDALKLLGNRVTALIQLLGSEISDKVGENAVDSVMRTNQIDELKAKVKTLIDQGFLVAADAIEENTFLVGTESEPAAADGTPGKVVHPRLQFTLSSLEKGLQEKLIGAKVGDTVSFKEGALVFNVAEIYKIVNPTPAPTAETPAPATDAAAPAPAATDASTTATPDATAAPAAPAPTASDAAPQSSSDAASAAPQAEPAAQEQQAAGN